MTTIKQYDLLNRLTNISSTTTSFTNSFGYLYNDANQRTKVTREDGSYWNYGYDDLGQVTSGKRYWADNTPVAGQQYDYDFDDIGNRKSTTSNSKPETRNSLYTANLLNQYTSRTVPGYADVLGTAHSNATVTVNYERAARKGEYWHKELALNNQGQAVYAGVTNIAVLNDGSNPDIVTTNTGLLFLPQTPEQFTYDHDGNLTGDGRWTYTWDGENRLIQMETKTGAVSAGTPKQKLEFAYDDQWRRIQKKVSDWTGSSYTANYTNKFAYDGWNLLTTLNPAALKQAFLWGKDLSGSQQGAGGVRGLIAISDIVNGAQFVAFDGNGNVASLADSDDGGQVSVYEYGPFGETIRMMGSLAQMNPFRFSTKYQDVETALIYYGYRYESTSGKWLGRDPLFENGGANLYNYCLNNAINYIDADGLISREYSRGNDDTRERIFETARIKIEVTADTSGCMEACSCVGEVVVKLKYTATLTTPDIAPINVGRNYQLFLDNVGTALTYTQAGVDGPAGDTFTAELTLGKIPCAGGDLTKRITVGAQRRPRPSEAGPGPFLFVQHVINSTTKIKSCGKIESESLNAVNYVADGGGLVGVVLILPLEI